MIYDPTERFERLSLTNTLIFFSPPTNEQNSTNKKINPIETHFLASTLQTSIHSPPPPLPLLHHYLLPPHSLLRILLPLLAATLTLTPTRTPKSMATTPNRDLLLLRPLPPSSMVKSSKRTTNTVRPYLRKEEARERSQRYLPAMAMAKAKTRSLQLMKDFCKCKKKKKKKGMKRRFDR